MPGPLLARLPEDQPALCLCGCVCLRLATNDGKCSACQIGSHYAMPDRQAQPWPLDEVGRPLAVTDVLGDIFGAER